MPPGPKHDGACVPDFGMRIPDEWTSSTWEKIARGTGLQGHGGRRKKNIARVLIRAYNNAVRVHAINNARTNYKSVLILRSLEEINFCVLLHACGCDGRRDGWQMPRFGAANYITRQMCATLRRKRYNIYFFPRTRFIVIFIVIRALV